MDSAEVNARNLRKSKQSEETVKAESSGRTSSFENYPSSSVLSRSEVLDILNMSDNQFSGFLYAQSVEDNMGITFSVSQVRSWEKFAIPACTVSISRLSAILGINEHDLKERILGGEIDCFETPDGYYLFTPEHVALLKESIFRSAPKGFLTTGDAASLVGVSFNHLEHLSAEGTVSFFETSTGFKLFDPAVITSLELPRAFDKTGFVQERVDWADAVVEFF